MQHLWGQQYTSHTRRAILLLAVTGLLILFSIVVNVAVDQLLRRFEVFRQPWSLKAESRSSSDIKLISVKDASDDIQDRQFWVRGAAITVGNPALLSRENTLTELSSGRRLGATHPLTLEHLFRQLTLNFHGLVEAVMAGGGGNAGQDIESHRWPKILQKNSILQFDFGRTKNERIN